MEKYFDEIVKSTAELLRFDSSLQEAEEGYPFGKGAGECLEYFLSLAESMGFETHNYDNYIGEVVFGEGEDFAILAHLDVVPAGNGWKYPPFGGVINDEPSDGGVEGTKIWGRGAVDDKTPAVVCLYALKALKEEEIAPKRTFKLIVGCNEEAGWKCIEHYNEVAKMPKEGFSPDANFPAIYAEKGIMQLKTVFPVEGAPVTAMKGGDCVNMVCAEGTALLTRKAAENLVYYENPVEGTRLSYDNTTNILRAYGKAAHGSTPDRGANALQAILYFLSTFNDDCKKAYDFLFNDEAGLKTLEDRTGKLTLSPNMATFKEGTLTIISDVRIPATLPLSAVVEKLEKSGVAYEIVGYKEPLYHDPKTGLIRLLTDCYNEATGENATPIAIGGGTYARALEKGCAFGPEFAGEEDVIHQANEYVTFDQIRKMCRIYKKAIYAIATEEKRTYRLGTIRLGKTEDPASETLVKTKFYFD